MNSFMMAFGFSSIALCLGTLLRAKVPALRKMLIPASVIAGIIGVIFMNAAAGLKWNVGTDAGMFTEVVNQLFTVSFICISLTSAEKTEGSSAKSIAKGAWGMGIVWCLLYSLTPLIGMLLIAVLGKGFDMDAIYGTLIPFGFAQGPGQAATYGTIYESYGLKNAAMVGVTFASVGFVAAFCVGIPMAKRAIAKGIAKNCGELDEIIQKGYLTKEQQVEVTNKDTTINSNIETLAFHFALIGLCYVGAVGIAKVFALIPGIGATLSGMMFLNGMIAAYIVKFIMKKLHIDFLLDNGLLNKLTGWTSDYLVVCAFMAVSVSVIGQWLVPILIECVVVTAVTYFICVYFGQRLGGSNDLERTLGLYGTSTGTIPSGIALVRIVDPGFKTATAVELGVTNMIMMLSAPAQIVMLMAAAGTLSFPLAAILLAACSLLYLVLLKLTKCWGKKTFSFK